MTMTSDQPLRTMSGPYTQRLCLAASGGGYRWIERPLRAHRGYLDAAGLAALRSRVPSGAVAVAIPALTAAGAAVWPAVATPALLADALFTPDAYVTLDTFGGLGEFAAGLHRATPPADMLPARTKPAWEHGDAVGRHERAAARARLPTGSARVLGGLAAKPAQPPAELALVHGRFTSALCVPGTTPTMLGWREAGLGDPFVDLAFLIAELVEAAAIEIRLRSTLRGAAETFLERYGMARGAPLSSSERTRLDCEIARRLLAHATARVWHAGDARGAGRLLLACEATIREMLPGIDVRAEVR